MSLLSIVIGADQPILRTKTTAVPKITKGILKLIKDMEETTVKAKGAGLAAPQVGSSHRLCIAMINRRLTPLINPQITWKSEEEVIAEEGCLSLPDVWLNVPRARAIRVKYIDAKAKEQELQLQNFDARVVQHEVDHLDGILIVDYREKAPQLGTEHIAM